MKKSHTYTQPYILNVDQLSIKRLNEFSDLVLNARD